MSGVRHPKTWKVRCKRCGVVETGIRTNEQANDVRSDHRSGCDGVTMTLAE